MKRNRLLPSLALATTSLACVGTGIATLASSPAVAAPSYPPLTLSKTVAHSGFDHGDFVTLSGDGCEAGDSATAYLLSGVVANDTKFIDIPETQFKGANGGIVNEAGHVQVDLVIPGGDVLALPSGTYSVRLTCSSPGSSNSDNWDVLFETRQIIINDGELPTTTQTAAPTTQPSTTTAPSTTMAPPAEKPAAAVMAQPVYTG